MKATTIRTLFASAGLLLAATTGQAQNVGIGTATPDNSAALDLQAADKGFLVPRLTAAQRTAIASPANALLVYQTDGAQPGFWYNAGTKAAPVWSMLGPGAGNVLAGDNLGDHTATQHLNLQGNALVGTGSNLGTTVGVGVTARGGLNMGQSTQGNITIGYQAGDVITTGSANQFFGYQSGSKNLNGNMNHFSGYRSGFANTQGSSNHFDGVYSGHSNTTGDNNQFTGFQSGYSNEYGDTNLFTGFASGYSNINGSDNVFFGPLSGYDNQSGNNNQFLGYASGETNTTGNNNLFVGYQSGINNLTGSNNWAFGYQAGPTSSALSNAGAIGYNAHVSQSNSLVLGGTGNDAVRVGIGSTAPRGRLDVSGSGDSYLVSNTANGNQQSLFLPGHLYLAPYNATTPVAFIQARIPNPTASTDLGLTFRTTNNGGLVEALKLNADGSAVFKGAVTAQSFSPSDERLKQGIRPLSGALVAVQALRGVRYTYRQDVAGHLGLPTGEQVGVIAQEVEKRYPELVSTGQDGYKAVNYAQLTPVLLEAIKELADQNAAFRQRTTQAEAATASLTDVVLGLAQRLRTLEASGARAEASH
jgi:hypothetical protein